MLERICIPEKREMGVGWGTVTAVEGGHALSTSCDTVSREEGGQF